MNWLLSNGERYCADAGERRVMIRVLLVHETQEELCEMHAAWLERWKKLQGDRKY